MNIKYKKLNSDFSADKLKRFFDVAMSGKTKKQCKGIIKNSSVIIGAFDKEKLVGISRSLDDNTYAFLTDVVVLTDYQRNGIGKKLVMLVCEQLKKNNIKIIFCNTSKDLINFYKNSVSEFEYNSDEIILKIENF